MTLLLLQHRAANGSRPAIAAAPAGAALVPGVTAIINRAGRAIAAGNDLAAKIASRGRGAAVDIAKELAADRLLSPIDHDPAHLIKSDTGLTQPGSVEGCDRMHRAAVVGATLNDPIGLFLESVAGGKPASGQTGQQSKWFYKEDRSAIVAPRRDPLAMVR